MKLQSVLKNEIDNLRFSFSRPFIQRVQIKKVFSTDVVASPLPRCTVKKSHKGAWLHFYLVCRFHCHLLLPSLSNILWGFVHLSYFAVIVLMFLSAPAWRASEQQVCPEPFTSVLFITTLFDLLFQAGRHRDQCGGRHGCKSHDW